jgi:hypothetical protein
VPVWGWCCPLPLCLCLPKQCTRFSSPHDSWRLASFHNTTSLFKLPSSPLLLSSLIMSAIAMTSSTTILAARPRATVSRYVAAELVVE